MVVSNPAANQGAIPALLAISLKQVLLALAAGLLLWLLMVQLVDASPVLLLVIAIQLGFLLVAYRFRGWKFERTGILAGVVVMVAAVILGVCYDVLLRLLVGAGTPTIGPWGEVRRLAPGLAGLIVIFGVLIGPAGDECFLRAGLFGSWQAEGRPWSGALLSSALFAAARLDPWNLVAYFGLGMLLCGTYRWTGSVLAVWIAHSLLNAILFVFLYCGYE